MAQIRSIFMLLALVMCFSAPKAFAAKNDNIRAFMQNLSGQYRMYGPAGAGCENVRISVNKDQPDQPFYEVNVGPNEYDLLNLFSRPQDSRLRAHELIYEARTYSGRFDCGDQTVTYVDIEKGARGQLARLTVNVSTGNGCFPIPLNSYSTDTCYMPDVPLTH